MCIRDRGYAVATSNEAMQLIAAGRKKPILILGLSFPEQFEEIVDNDVRPAVCTYETAKAVSYTHLSQSLQKLLMEDLTLNSVNDSENGQTVLYGIGDMQLEVCLLYTSRCV